MKSVVLSVFGFPDAVRTRAMWLVTFLCMSAVPSSAQVLSQVTIRDLAWEQRPYYVSWPWPLPDTEPCQDAEGVRMFCRDGVQSDHPVNQASYALWMLGSYKLSNNPAHLDRALLHAQRLIDRRVESRNAWYFPYPFSFALHGIQGEDMPVPWFSAMAQGQALSLFSELWEFTGNPYYLDVANRVFESFHNSASPSEPWVVFLDAEGYLWFEEYARDPVIGGDFTFNGHMFAVWGLYDYYHATGNPEALRLFRAGIATVKRYGPSELRTPGYMSKYCLRHRIGIADYHQYHVMQLISLFRITGDVALAKLVDEFVADYPDHRIKTTAVFSGGPHEGRRFPAGSKFATLTRASQAPANSRRTISGQPGVWLEIAAGIWAGWWVQESPPNVYAYGVFQPITFDPSRRIVFQPGSYTFYRYDSKGQVINSITSTWTAGTWARFDQHAIINSVPHVRISLGGFSGYWLRLGPGITLD
jgi:hypothetical protein